ncbi:MAG: DUF2800 domain-containing protein [Candidatus Tokpelaia sp.]|uniref:DUF2800 domain-containing protein n=1 Tax=Candidatus Tokpelaia sp. TaxID=2233777 RepID=UPI00123AF285|nr:DUF2800 domain-containing protein [Candidatus Tokpelaia sp.]KAA6205671.1 MAG: DUF2800 domain-containing protein [Candidatus Tokpelaia sp.]KAA6207287.1 MAG: DUF2800 domain-containing protein [Candidatus Tokpelaia sp.]KAA6405192.1 hypothetical protein DPQ22_06585 [Candidatus Tokpelaia sp.]
MQLVATRGEMAAFLQQVKAADFPLSVTCEAAVPAVYNGQGEQLCRYIRKTAKDDESFPPEQIKQLENIVRLINQEALAVADDSLRATAAEGAVFRDIIRRLWAKKAENDLIARSSVLTQAAKRHLREELAIALFGRLVKAGIMPLHRISCGREYYDRRFYQDPGRLRAFLHMSAVELARCLAPSPATVLPAAVRVAPPPIFPGDGAKPGRNAGEKQAAARSLADFLAEGFAEDFHKPVLAAAAEFLPGEGQNKWGGRQARRRGGKSDYGFSEEAAAPLLPENALAAENDTGADSELFSDPRRANEEGTLKHKIVADKLRKELSPIFAIHGVPIFKFDRPIIFEMPEKQGWGRFNKKEINEINSIMRKLLDSDIVLVEYSLPVTRKMAGIRKQIDVVAFNSATRILKIIDWKFGTVPVTIDNNAQLKSYVQCLLKEVFLNDNVERIQVFIVQPNWQGIKSWESSKESFL